MIQLWSQTELVASHPWKTKAINLGARGEAPILLILIRNVDPKVRPFEFQPIGLLKKSATNGLSKALHFEEDIPVLRAALGADNNRVPRDLRLIEKFLHQELVLVFVVRKFVNAEKAEVAIIPDSGFQLFGISL